MSGENLTQIPPLSLGDGTHKSSVDLSYSISNHHNMQSLDNEASNQLPVSEDQGNFKDGRWSKNEHQRFLIGKYLVRTLRFSISNEPQLYDVIDSLINLKEHISKYIYSA